MANYSLKNLTKPTLIMVSSYLLIYMVAFFVQLNNKNINNGYSLENVTTGVQLHNMIPEIMVITPEKELTPQIKVPQPIIPVVVDSIQKDTVLASGEIAP